MSNHELYRRSTSFEEIPSFFFCSVPFRKILITPVNWYFAERNGTKLLYSPHLECDVMIYCWPSVCPFLCLTVRKHFVSVYFLAYLLTDVLQFWNVQWSWACLAWHYSRFARMHTLYLYTNNPKLLRNVRLFKESCLFTFVPFHSAKY